ncbi:TPA: class I SAM-dependent methyltransferase [Candidatus Woesearchaeota archaeon]|nr:class I SAM-dependent methyltransferase [Candidatus Woesearchaeota archaeon]
MLQWDEIYKKDPTTYKYYDLLQPHEDMPRIAALLKKRKATRVLDLGCGSGRNLFFLDKLGFDVAGIDIAPAGIKTIKDRIKGVDAKVGDIYTRLPYPDASFDAVISVQVLQHNTAPNIKRAIAEIRRILKPGGILFLTVGGRISKNKVRFCLVLTAKKIAPNTYVPTNGDEKGLTHFIYNKKLLREHFKDFTMLDIWKDSKDYYCVLFER